MSKEKLDDIDRSVIERAIQGKNEIFYLIRHKGNERYYFFYDRDSEDRVLPKICEFVNSSSLSLTWYDAALLSNEFRKQV